MLKSSLYPIREVIRVLTFKGIVWIGVANCSPLIIFYSFHSHHQPHPHRYGWTHKVPPTEFKMKILILGIYCRLSIGSVHRPDWPIIVTIPTVNIIFLASIFEVTIQCMLHFIYLGVLYVNSVCSTHCF